jgi:hypothetical protein
MLAQNNILRFEDDNSATKLCSLEDSIAINLGDLALNFSETAS